MGLAVWLPVTCAYSFQSAFHVQNVWQQCDQLRNEESDSEDLSETEMPCLNAGCSDLNQKQLKRKKGMQTKAVVDSISEIADPEKEAKKRKLMEEMPDKKGCFKDSSGDKIKEKKDKEKSDKKDKKNKKTKRETKEPKHEMPKAKAKPKAKTNARAKPGSDESSKRNRAEEAQATMVATLARVQKEYAEAIAEPEPDDEQGLEARKRQITAKKVMMG